MTYSQIISDVAIPIICAAVLPSLYILFKELRELDREQVRMMERVTHIENNYKQGIGHLNDQINKVFDELRELRAEIQALLVRQAQRRRDDD